MLAFAGYIGIDYSGAKTPTANVNVRGFVRTFGYGQQMRYTTRGASTRLFAQGLVARLGSHDNGIPAPAGDVLRFTF